MQTYLTGIGFENHQNSHSWMKNKASKLSQNKGNRLYASQDYLEFVQGKPQENFTDREDSQTYHRKGRDLLTSNPIYPNENTNSTLHTVSRIIFKTNCLPKHKFQEILIYENNTSPCQNKHGDTKNPAEKLQDRNFEDFHNEKKTTEAKRHTTQYEWNPN